ncbi:hypothetical protein V7O62_01625 [Methanolobus sp. ZRKC2]|uniref:hypothetical protein n=1 Tax=Methanolobus sp. ZRKC2 TaxID=3125783 RepID=UPI0032471932
MDNKKIFSLLFMIFFITLLSYAHYAGDYSTTKMNSTVEVNTSHDNAYVNCAEFDDTSTNSSSSSVDNTQEDILEIEKLKVPGTIAMSISESYPFKKNEVWNKSYVEEGETIKSYIFLANYKNESHEFLIFNLVDYTQKPSYLGGNLSVIHNFTLEKDNYVVFCLETVPFNQAGEHLFQVAAVVDPYKTEPTGKCGFMDTGYLYLSPKVLVIVNETKGKDVFFK